MKIAFISHSSVVFNYRDKLRLLAKKKGVELTLFLPEAWFETGKRLHSTNQSATKEGFPIVSLPIVLENRIRWHFYPNLSAQLEALKPDIIHVEEEPPSFVAWQATRAALKLKAKLIFFTWENIFDHFPIPHQQAIFKFVLKNTDMGIVGNEEGAGILRRLGMPASKVTVMPQYGVNPDIFKKKPVSKLKKSLKLGPYTISYVGRLIPEKGIGNLFQAFKDLNNPKANLLVVGGGPMKVELEQTAAQMGIAGQVRWVSSIDQSLVPDYLNCLDVLVLPSLTTAKWKEQFGRVIIEAQACEVPVIGSDSGAIPEVVGKAGAIFPEGDTQALTRQLRKFSASPFRRKVGKLARKRVLDLYTNQKLADRIYDIYRKLLKSR